VHAEESEAALKIGVVAEGPVTPRNWHISEEWGSLEAALEANLEPDDRWRRAGHAVQIAQEDDSTLMLIDIEALETEAKAPWDGELYEDPVTRLPGNAARIRPLRVTPSFVRRMSEAAPMFTLTNAAYLDLVFALGSDEQVVGFLSELANEQHKPVGMNIAKPDGSSTTAFIPPKGWTQERLAGWVATRQEALEAQFGKVAGTPRSRFSRKARRQKDRDDKKRQ
jgi:hypothetical protein